MRFFCVPSFFPRIHFQIHEAFAQLRDSDISVLQSGLLRIDRLSLPDFSSRRFLFLSGGSSSPTAFPLRSYIKHPRTASALSFLRQTLPSYTEQKLSYKHRCLSVHSLLLLPHFTFKNRSPFSPPFTPGIPFPRRRILLPVSIPAGI